MKSSMEKMQEAADAGMDREMPMAEEPSKEAQMVEVLKDISAKIGEAVKSGDMNALTQVQGEIDQVISEMSAEEGSEAEK